MLGKILCSEHSFKIFYFVKFDTEQICYFFIKKLLFCNLIKFCSLEGGMEDKRLTSDNMPSCYKGHITSTTILSNLYKLVNYLYSGDTRKFLREYKKILRSKKAPLTTDEAISKTKGLSTKIRGSNGRMLRLQDAVDIISTLNLPEDCLLLPEGKKEVAYVFVECVPQNASKLFESLKEPKLDNKLIDECSLLAGDSDLFLRLYGTREEIRIFIFDVLGVSDEIIIQRTKTHFSFTDDIWQRYPTKSHEMRESSRPYWLPVEWSMPVEISKSIT